MLDGSLSTTGIGLGTLYVLTTRVEPNPKPGELGFKIKVQDILGCWTRCAKINHPRVGFVWSRFVQKIPKQTGFLVSRLCITISVNKDLRECLTKAISDRNFCKEILDAIMKDFDKMGRTYKAKLTTKVECTQLRSQVTSLKSELADLTQRFTILGQMKDEERTI